MTADAVVTDKSTVLKEIKRQVQCTYYLGGRDKKIVSVQAEAKYLIHSLQRTGFVVTTAFGGAYNFRKVHI